ncbi:MAG: acyl-ACP--UDP-N-acetylglucosamine O-acyltransferase [Candidatus Omnitrophota bacterium]
MNIHPTAVIDKKAKLAADVQVGPYAVIGPDVTIGAGTIIDAHCVIDRFTTIGKKCHLFPSAVIGAATQDLKYKGGESFVDIGDENIIREFVTVNRGTDQKSVTRIGNNNLIMAYAHIAHDCVIGNNVIIANGGTLAGYVTLEDKVIIGGLSGIHQFVRIGTLAIIGGCSKVVKHIPPYAMADGHPTKVYGLNIIGLTRAGVSSATKTQLKRAFKILFNSGLSLPHALKEIDDTVKSVKEIKILTTFLKTVKADTKRGVCR